MFMEEFILKVMELLEERIDEEYTILKDSIVKANDTVKNAITVHKRGENIAKNIYLEKYFKMYQKGYAIDNIVDDMLKEAVGDNSDILNSIGKDFFNDIRDYEKVKDRIIIKLLNKDMNKSYLEDKIYVPYKDLVAVFCLVCNDMGNGMASVCITRSIFECWKVSQEQVYNQALKITQTLFPAKIEDIGSILLEIGGSIKDIIGNEEYSLDDDKGKYFYVLSNEQRINGAATIMYEGILKNFAYEQEVDEVVIIPSSIHETLLIPKSGNDYNLEKKCYEMVNEVNATSVEPEEVLSNNIYIYSRIADEVTIWNE